MKVLRSVRERERWWCYLVGEEAEVVVRVCEMGEEEGVCPCPRAQGVAHRRRRLLHRWVLKQGLLLLVRVSRVVERLAVVVRRSKRPAARICLSS